MILADTSVWVDHLRKGSTNLAERLEKGEIICHPFVVGELACGQLRNRERLLTLLQKLQESKVAMQSEVLGFIERHGLAGQGIGWVDAHLLAATALTPNTRLWTFDKRLARAAARLKLLA